MGSRSLTPEAAEDVAGAEGVLLRVLALLLRVGNVLRSIFFEIGLFWDALDVLRSAPGRWKRFRDTWNSFRDGMGFVF